MIPKLSAILPRAIHLWIVQAHFAVEVPSSPVSCPATVGELESSFIRWPLEDEHGWFHVSKKFTEAKGKRTWMDFPFSVAGCDSGAQHRRHRVCYTGRSCSVISCCEDMSHSFSTHTCSCLETCLATFLLGNVSDTLRFRSGHSIQHGGHRWLP